jgi:HD-GYP domain-containing protein (c-di-GMP phosphodiesterase class II)
MHRKAVAVSDLQFGMYIAELDRPWTETPFAFQGFSLRTANQLEALRKLCKHVFVEVAHSGARPLGVAWARPPQSSAPAFAMHGNAGYTAPTDLEREIEAASVVYSQTYKALEALLRPLQNGATALNGAEVQRRVAALADSVIRNPDALLLVSKLRETGVAAHARALQVCVYMMVFGRFLQREPDEIRLLGLLGLLQDIGNARLPSALFEMRGPFTPQADGLLRKHVELSAHIVGVTSGLPPKFANLVLLHHERQDGTGYPRGLRGYQIGLSGSIAAICDAYDALLAPPPYGEGRSPADANQLLMQDRGTAFHGPLLEQFTRCMGAFPVGSVVELTTGELAVVVGEHPMQRLKPKVLVLRDRGGEPVPARKIDLASEPDTRIRRTLEQGTLAFDPRQLF